MRGFLIPTIGLLSSLVILSCSQKEPYVEDTLTVSPSSLVFPSDGGTQSLSITTNTSWSISVNAAWLIVNESRRDSSGGCIEVEVKNNDGDTRSANIKISAGSKSVSVDVIQETGYILDGIPRLSISEFRQLPDDSSVWNRISGEIVSIVNSQYGDMYLMDETGYIYVYGLAPEKDGNTEDFPRLGLKPGQIISIFAHKKNYQGIIETDKAYFDSVKDKPYPGGNSDKSSFSWMELPATADNDGLTYLYHLDNSGERNYSAYFDGKHRISSWVSYPLFDSENNDKRSDAYAFDPLVPEEQQANLTRSYQNRTIGGEEYVRGHMIPSYDRKGRRNLDLFLSTNIIPQSTNLNGGVWESLESMTRLWKKSCDTLYVVVGADYKDSTMKVRDNSDKPREITVPNGLYKVILAYSKENGYCGLASYFENRAYSSKTFTKEMAMSIDELENKLGMDFFVNLPGVVGDSEAKSIEAENPADNGFWW